MRCPFSVALPWPADPEFSGDLSGLRVRVGDALAEGSALADSVRSGRTFEGRSVRLPRSFSDFSLRSREGEAEAEEVVLGVEATSMIGAGAGVSATVRLRATTNPSLLALSSSAVVLTVVGALSAVS